ncbi:MAG TPA: hypothetical protein VMT89_17970 [Candidatus Acidoferrales bacterium]|nr:hypothetical protein [Candidatus Acidoferrales bacterium]
MQASDEIPAQPRVRIPYPLLCALIGLPLGWIPRFLHGPIPEKFNVLYIKGAIAVWGWYTARMLIGLIIGITYWPERWYLRGPMIGFMTLFPLTLVSLATPTCGAPCMCWNLTTATVVGTLIAGIAFALTGKHRL